MWKGEFAEASKLLIDLEAGSAIEKIQNCHIGNYMEGYLRIGTSFYKCFYCSSEPSLLLFCVDFRMALTTPLIFKKTIKKGEK